MRCFALALLLLGCGSKPNLLGDGSGEVDARLPAAFAITGNAALTARIPSSLTLHNTGLGASGAIGIEIQGDDSKHFLLEHSTCTSLAPGESCTFDVTYFTASDKVLVMAPLFAGNDATTARVDLTGTGNVTPPGMLVITGPSFPDTVINEEVMPATVFTVTNNSASTSGSLTIDVNDTEQFGIDQGITSDTCSGQSLPPNGSCVVPIRFTPTLSPAIGAHPVTISASSTSGLSGALDRIASSVPLIEVSPIDMIQLTGSSCAAPPPQATFTITNHSVSQVDESITLISNTQNFTVTDNCAPKIAARSSCTIVAKPVPTGAVGLQTMAIQLTTTASGQSMVNSLKVASNSTPCELFATPNPLNFGAQSLGTQTSLVLDITNASALARTLATSLPTNTTFGILSDGCNNVQVAANAKCQIAIRFAPTQPVSSSAQLRISSPGIMLPVLLLGSSHN